ncbi:amine oxidase domain protein [Mycobacterium xenopi 3993]|nr:amine oxidase domain protein [Mycobacterium xenopi 3993]
MHWLRRLPNGVQVQAGEAAPRFFDAAVVAVHPDQALLLLDDPRRTSARFSARSATARTARCCTPTSRCCPAVATPAPRGTT